MINPKKYAMDRKTIGFEKFTPPSLRIACRGVISNKSAKKTGVNGVNEKRHGIEKRIMIPNTGLCNGGAYLKSPELFISQI